MKRRRFRARDYDSGTREKNFTCHMTCYNMSTDRSSADLPNTMSDRKQQLLDTAIEIISDQGYGNLTMRALARADGLTLGALQYHFPTWNDLLTALADYIHTEYARVVYDSSTPGQPIDIIQLAELLLDDEAGQKLLSDRLLPQLWALGRVEPVMKQLLERIYQDYLTELEQSLASAGSDTPRAEALALMSLIEGTTLFLDSESAWASNGDDVKAFVLDSLRDKYGQSRENRNRLRGYQHG